MSLQGPSPLEDASSPPWKTDIVENPVIQNSRYAFTHYNSEWLTFHQQLIQKHFLQLLHISDYSCLDQLLPPPSDDENLAFNRHDPGRIKITPNDFHINLLHSCRMPFNTEAICVFAKDFNRKVEESKWYSFPTPPPAHFLQLEYIELSLYLHLHYVKDVYTNLKKSEEMHCTRLRRATHSTHKTRVHHRLYLHALPYLTCPKLYTSRADCVTNDDELIVHNDLIQLIGSQGVSSDELDTDSNGHKVYLIIPPAWRSEELANLMCTIDSMIISNHWPRVGHRSVRGQEPRHQVPSNLINEDAVAPLGLPLNCYKGSWLTSLLPNKRQKLNAWADKWYNFESGKTEVVVPPHAGATLPVMQTDNENSDDTSIKLEDNDGNTESGVEDFTTQLSLDED
ncbi:hypothetical protein BKA82DRAFT_20809 [Pisolithus tinctorius]|uniref:Uncharacterized protein n=1 Tax=Pisolithus tinctorius Marx 270 TaxID=870435 RepID=A0A0C3JQE0_PISTI|nr:hypothetical protein BKA82DRAFT_20809 [Pisolithus tinctorius]KIO11363.1 hypothetical protein M404DRAFT_20809 [Pisolithus tinctorius Marx 270]